MSNPWGPGGSRVEPNESLIGVAYLTRIRDALQNDAMDFTGGTVTPGIAHLDFLVATSQAADSAQTITPAAVLGGIYLRSGMTAGRTDTLPTAALLVAAVGPGAKIGTAIPFRVMNQNGSAFTLTLAAGAGGTLVSPGTWTAAQSNTKLILIVLTNVTAGAEAYNVYSLGAASAA